MDDMSFFVKNSFKFLNVIVVFFAIAASDGVAQITVDNVIVGIAATDRPVKNVIVGNRSDNTAYVTVEVEKVEDAAKDSDKVSATPDVLVSPKAFSIEAKGQRTVRLLLKTRPSQTEAVYRISFVPQDRGFGEEVVRSSNGRTAVLRVLTGMGMLFFAEPPQPHVDLKWVHSGHKLTVTNVGNRHVLFSDGKSCNEKKACTDLPSTRLYAGATFDFTSPPGNTVTLLKKRGSRRGLPKNYD